MKFVFAGLFFIGSIFFSFAAGRDWQIVVIAVATILGFVLGQLLSVQKELKSLRQSLAEDWATRNAAAEASPQTSETNVTTADSPTEFTDIEREANREEADQRDYVDALAGAAASVSSNQTADQAAIAETLQSGVSLADQNASVYIPPQSEHTTKDTTAKAKSDVNEAVAEESILEKATALVKNYFSGGNMFVRIGIIVLFFGVSFLLKYVSDRGFFPIEYRLIGVVIGAMFLLGLGWRLRHKNETYALLLQGAGIGVLYLDIYAAFSLYQLIPPMAAFTLLFIVSMFSAALAVLQDSKSLAVLGFSGGFLAPVLASSGSNNHVALFSYYAILNLAIVAIAWFKAWRPLNLLGFAFTFVIGAAWGVFSYNSSKFDTTEPFLVLFFVFYVLIAVLFALRQPPKLRGYVDGTLLFGVPLAASALQYPLVKDFEYGVSISSFVMGAFYLLLSWFVWKRKGDGLKLLAEAFLALGVIFASMAIPFALAPTQTAAAWALEGAGLLWLGSRQNRLSVRGFGVLLQIAAGVIYLWRYSNISSYQAIADLKPFINGEFISSMMLAIAGVISARLLIKPYDGKKSVETSISLLLLIWGLIWLFGGFIHQLAMHYEDHFLPSNILILSAVVSLLFTLIAIRFKPEWKHAWLVPTALFCIVLLMAFSQYGITLFGGNYHPFQWYGWLAWPAVFAVYYFYLRKLEAHQLWPRLQSIFHSVLSLLLIVLVTLEGDYLIGQQLGKENPASSAWLGLWYAIPATIALWLIVKAKFWPFSSQQKTYSQQTAVVIAAYLSLWSFLALTAKGISDPLPWLPLLNPLDIMLGIVFISLYKWWKSSAEFAFIAVHNATNKSFNQRAFAVSLAALGFLWLNFTLFRIAHHWFDIPYQAQALFDSNLVQTSVSILWALSGVLLTLYSSHRKNRVLWVTGAVLLGLVVLKLFVIDLSALGSLGRIISFLVVGALLISIGYFAPLPNKNENSDESVDQDNSNKEMQDA